MATDSRRRANSRTRRKQFVKNEGTEYIRGGGRRLDAGKGVEVGGETYNFASQNGLNVYQRTGKTDTGYFQSGPEFKKEKTYEVKSASFENTLQPDKSEISSESTDQKNPAENVGERQKAAGRKRQGRGSLRISAKGNGGGSAGRLKQGGGVRNRSSGAQGGGRSGLNIPR